MSRLNTEQSHLAKCPYYKCESRNTIFCEGVQPGCAIHMAFENAPGKRAYESRFCRKVWGDCMIAAAQNARYVYDTWGS